MHRLTLNISDNSFKKIFEFLKKFSEKEVKIIENQMINKTQNDFIYNLINNPLNLNNDIKFFSREQANER